MRTQESSELEVNWGIDTVYNVYKRRSNGK